MRPFFALALPLILAVACAHQPPKILAAACTAAASKPQQLWSLEGFAGPESAVWDPKTQAIYVSNVAGEALKKDGQGWISKVSLEGQMLQAQWAAGARDRDPKRAHPLNAPKGIAIRDGILWVADIDHVEAFRLDTAERSASIPVPGSVFLNDVAFDPDNPSKLYVSDMTGGAIYVLEDSSTAKPWIQGAQLEMPNGLRFASPGTLLVAGWGQGLNPDFSTQSPGRLLSIDVATQKVSPWRQQGLGNLDGLEMENAKSVLVSDWVAGKVYRVDPAGSCEILVEGIQGAADIGWIADKRILLLPRMNENRLEAWQL